jgi:hypothetical protein
LALDLNSTSPPNFITNLNGDRRLRKTSCKANVPPKVFFFTWKLATNSLDVQVHRSRGLPHVLPTCSICGMEEKTGYHATMKSTKALALRQGLADVW